MQDRLIKYVRNSSGKKVGCVIALRNVFNSEVYIGWSQCHPKDTFSKEKAIEIAIGRALKGSIKIPAKVDCKVDGDCKKQDLFKEEIVKMKLRAKAFFKQN